MLTELNSRLGLALTSVGFVENRLGLLLITPRMILQRVHTVKEEFTERLPYFEAFADEILLAAELHVFLSGEIATAIAAVPK
jgi:hypothetical protein